MRSFVSVSVAAWGAAVAFGAIVVAKQIPPGDTPNLLFAVFYRLVALAQVFPVLGVFFCAGKRHWSPTKRAIWVLWLVPASLVLVAGAVSTIWGLPSL